MAAKSPLSSPLIYHAPNNIFLHRRHRSHAIITSYGRRKKNGENPSRLRDVTVCLLTFFSIKLLTGRFLHRRRSRPLAFIKRTWQRKKNGENQLFFDDHTFFHSPFFQLNCYFRGYRAFRDIIAHRRIFTTPPPACFN